MFYSFIITNTSEQIRHGENSHTLMLTVSNRSSSQQNCYYYCYYNYQQQ